MRPPRLDLDAATAAHPPPAVAGRRIRLRYMTQANARPSTFVVFCSQPKALPTSYSRYLVNGLRESFDLPAFAQRQESLLGNVSSLPVNCFPYTRAGIV